MMPNKLIFLSKQRNTQSAYSLPERMQVHHVYKFPLAASTDAVLADKDRLRWEVRWVCSRSLQDRLPTWWLQPVPRLSITRGALVWISTLGLLFVILVVIVIAAAVGASDALSCACPATSSRTGKQLCNCPFNDQCNTNPACYNPRGGHIPGQCPHDCHFG